MTFVLLAFHAGNVPDTAPIKNANPRQPIIKYAGNATLSKSVPKDFNAINSRRCNSLQYIEYHLENDVLVFEVINY